MPELADKLTRLHERIARAAARAGRSPDSITLVAVTKTVPADRIRAAYLSGVRHFGENRVQEAEAKIPQLSDLAATWRFVGRLQSNKAKRAASLFHAVDSLDSLHAAERLQTGLPDGQLLPVLVEVRLGGEETKSGVEPEKLLAFLEQLSRLSRLSVRGLMTLPPLCPNPEDVRPYFRQLRELAERVAAARISGITMQELSMGMSYDFEVAIEEGATMVRIGTAIFGERPG
jgi:pyridoxal phosphate enzyme (YggS family)